ncbi:MAG: LPS-assembly protein LptD, partial [Gammaproteobacteria bacterium]|nr:LPS-assembly protein LptD [Gammaproteobacteria bacterium]
MGKLRHCGVVIGIAGAVALLSLPSAWAADAPPDWSLCTDLHQFPQTSLFGPPRPPELDEEAPVTLTADESEMLKEGVSLFRGDVHITQGTRRLTADELEYESETEIGVLHGDVTFGNSEIEVNGDSAKVNFATETGEFDEVDYRLFSRHARGEAKKVITEGESYTRLDGVLYTTCPTGNNAWNLRAKKIALDHEKGVGTGRNVVLRFMGVPFFYTPWISFPIDNRRKSGFLVPQINDSGRRGFELLIPYYWNIAP